MCVDLAPNAFAIGSADGVTRVFEFDGGRVKIPILLRRHVMNVTVVRFSHDADRVLTGFVDFRCRLTVGQLIR
jgi:hypothetical protein